MRTGGGAYAQGEISDADGADVLYSSLPAHGVLRHGYDAAGG